MSKSQLTISISHLSIHYSDASAIFQKFLSDHPHYFYISKSCIVSYNSRTGTATEITLRYTDGTVADQYDSNFNMIATADRAIITEKIARLQSVIESILETIPANCSDLEKEKIIHDYIVQNITYDTTAAQKVENYEYNLPHAFDIYGAAVEGSAVCEGYTKLFQYLCYCVGINSTQVIGYFSDFSHMWNAVLINGDWYHIDTTWADYETAINYSYFNITTEQILLDHKIGGSELILPECTATNSSFMKKFAIYIKNTNSAPENYENAINAAIKFGDTQLCIYIEEFAADPSVSYNSYINYIKTYILNPNSDVGRYITSKGLSVSSTIYTINNHFILVFNA